MRKPALLFSLVSLFATTAACSDTGNPDTPAPTGKPDTLKVGMVLSLTGSAQALGEEAKRGAEVAVAQINGFGGIRGKQIELVVENDASDPNQTHDKVKAFADQGIKFGIGPSTSNAAAAIKDLILSEQVVYISPSATSGTLDALDGKPVKEPISGQAPDVPVLFRTAATDVFLSAAMSQYASNPPSDGKPRLCSKVVLLQQDDDYGTPIGTAITKYLRSFDIPVADPVIKLEPTPDPQALAKIASQVGDLAIRPATLQTGYGCQVVVAQPAVAGAYMLEFQKYRTTAANANNAIDDSFITIGSDGFRQNEFIIASSADPAHPEKSNAGEGSYAVAADSASAQSQQFNAFSSLFNARFPGVDPGRYGSTAYDAMMLLGMALERTGFDAGAPLKPLRDSLYFMSQGAGTGKKIPVDARKFTDLFAHVRAGENVDYTGASGFVNFAPDGHVNADFGIWQITNGAYVFKKPFSSDTLGSGLQQAVP